MDVKKLIKSVKVLSEEAKEYSDPFLEEMVNRSINIILNTYNLEELPERYSSEVVDLAIIGIERLGVEGLESYTEGDISYAFEEGIPKSISCRLARLNKGTVREF